MTRTGKSRLVGAAGAVTALGMLAVATIGQFEGLRLVAYQDVIGVWTACYGETKGVAPGMKFTKDQCDVMFVASLAEHEAGMRACLAAPDTLPVEVYVADLSLAYNIGVGGFCRSSIAGYQNAGRIAASCDRFLLYDKAGGKVVAGLARRRQAERALCLKGARSAANDDAPAAVAA